MMDALPCRYADVVVHRQLLAALAADPTDPTPRPPVAHADLTMAAARMNEQHRAAKAAQKECCELYLLLLLHAQPHVESALVVEVQVGVFWHRAADAGRVAHAALTLPLVFDGLASCTACHPCLANQVLLSMTQLGSTNQPTTAMPQERGQLEVFVPRYHVRGRVQLVDGQGLAVLPLTGDAEKVGHLMEEEAGLTEMPGSLLGAARCCPY